MHLPDFESEIMNLNVKADVPFLTYKRLEDIRFINHAFSTRLGGVSTGEFTSMNLAFNRGDNPESVTENYQRLCSAAGFDFNTLVASAQDHNTVVRKVTAEDCGIGITRPRDLQSVDALVTDKPGVTLVTYYADCTPVYFVDTEKRVIALAHAGWRGTVSKICKKVIDTMVNDYGSNPRNIICCVGPAIAQCCYEIDQSCYNEFAKLSELDLEKIMTARGNGKYMANLTETNKQILMLSGVPEENITISDVCTKCNSELLWSHRATNGKRGTMCAFMCINA
ncbi:MAG: peptidoglycan editing factor PgeF [Acutalibacteraceae bacterium]|nr:peptidoglycan editing factor PgeF [Acutalibacteraceae bacterium]